MNGGGIQERIAVPRMNRHGDAGHLRTRSLLRTTPSHAPPPRAHAPAGEPNIGLAFGGLTKDGLIQERMRFPGRRGDEVMRTVASRVVSHTPSHYAMLGVPRDFTDAQLRKQYRLLALRFHPDAAARHGIPEAEATERFHAMQTAYEVLSDPQRRRRYDLEARLQHRREWRRAAWDTPMQLVDKSGSGVEEEPHQIDVSTPRAGDPGHHYTASDEGGGGSAAAAACGEASSSSEGAKGEDEQALEADLIAADRAERARRWDVERLAWLQRQIEAQEQAIQQRPLSGKSRLSIHHHGRGVSFDPMGMGRKESSSTPGGGGSSSLGEQVRQAKEQRSPPLPSTDGRDEDGLVDERVRQAKAEEAEARARAEEAERQLRHAKEKARRKAQEAKLRREAEEREREAAKALEQQQEEERAMEVEARVRRQVEERARRQGMEAARREAAESVLAAEERARLATLAAEEKALKLQAELGALQSRLEEAEAIAERASLASASVAASAYASEIDGDDDDGDDDDEAGPAVDAAVRRVEEATREEYAERDWQRRAVSALGDFPELPAPIVATAVDEQPNGSGGGGGGGGNGEALNELVRWVCIRVPKGRVGGRSVLMDTPYGRFAVLIPPGLPAGTPLLVPVPAAGAPTQVGHSSGGHSGGGSSLRDPEREAAKEEQLRELLEVHGVSAAEAAQYCDGVTPVAELLEMIASDAQALEHHEEVPSAEEGASSPKGSSFCVVS